MKRREFIAFCALALASLKVKAANAAKKIAKKDILQDGQPSNVPNYCSVTKKTKSCPAEIKGKCSECMFYDQDKSLAKSDDGKEVARCTILSDPSKPQFVYADYTCAVFQKKT